MKCRAAFARHAGTETVNHRTIGTVLFAPYKNLNCGQPRRIGTRDIFGEAKPVHEYRGGSNPKAEGTRQQKIRTDHWNEQQRWPRPRHYNAFSLRFQDNRGGMSRHDP